MTGVIAGQGGVRWGRMRARDGTVEGTEGGDANVDRRRDEDGHGV